MKQNRFPLGWDEARVRKVLQHYEKRNEEESVAEDEAALQSSPQAVMVVPKRLVPEFARLLEKRRSVPRRTSSPKPRVRELRTDVCTDRPRSVLVAATPINVRRY